MAAESKLEKHLLKRVKELKGTTRKIKWVGRRGAPDRLVWVPKWRYSVLIEMKSPGKPLEAHQKREHRRLRKMGFVVYKLDTIEQIDRLLRV